MPINLDSDKDLFEHPAVKWVFWVTVSVALFIFSLQLASVVVFYDFCFKPMCIKTFFNDVFKIPFGVVAAGSAFIGLISANLRSIQSNKSLEVALQAKLLSEENQRISSNQNAHVNYYAHTTQFSSYIEQSSLQGYVKSVGALYRFLFPRAKSGELTFDDKAINLYINKLEDFRNNIQQDFISMPQSDIRDALATHRNCISYFSEMVDTLKLRMHFLGTPYLFAEDKVNNSIRSDSICATSLASFVAELVSFDPIYDESRILGLTEDLKIIDYASKSKIFAIRLTTGVE